MNTPKRGHSLLSKSCANIRKSLQVSKARLELSFTLDSSHAMHQNIQNHTANKPNMCIKSARAPNQSDLI